MGEHHGRLAPAPQERAHAGDELLARERLDEVVVGARVQPGDAVRNAVAGGEEQDRQREPLRAQPPTDGEAVHPRHGDVEDDEVRDGPLNGSERAASVRRRRDIVPFRRERALEHAPNRGVVVDDEDRGGGHDPRVAPRGPSRPAQRSSRWILV